MATPTFLVTGGAGFIGSALVRQLVLGGDATVANLDLLTYAGNLDSLGAARSHPAHHFHRADVADREAVRRVFQAERPDAVIHLAAESHVDRSIDDPATFVRTNVLGTAALLDEAMRYWRTLPPDAAGRFRFIHVSTDEVFGPLGPGTPPIGPDAPYRPSSPYAASKAAADHLVRACSRTYGFPAIIAAGTNSYGPCQFPEKLIPLHILKALAGEPMPVYGDGRQVRDWLHVDDHVAALLRVLERGRVGATYLVSAGAERRNLQVAETIADLVDASAPPLPGGRKRRELLTFVADRPGHDARYALDASATRRELGWEPRQDFDAGLRGTVAWYLEHRDWWERVRSGAYRGERLGLGPQGEGRG